MKVFIWTGVLRDYTDGMAVGYGETLEEVLALFPDHIADALGVPTTVIDCDTHTTPVSEYVYGGG
jgi:hypothetical protein